MKKPFRLLLLLALCGIFSAGRAQFTGGVGSGMVLVELNSPSACRSFAGGTADGADFFLLPNPDDCGSYKGDSLDGAAVFFLVNPDSCGLFEGSAADGSGTFFYPSPVPCPTFYGSVSDGATFGFLSCQPLAVQSSPLQGRVEEEEGVLWWNTYSEINNVGFTIERSRDRVEWESIGFQEGQDQSSTTLRYEFRDADMPEGISYYRYEQLDFDGSLARSNVVVLHRDGSLDGPSLLLYPVPLQVGEELHVLYKSSLQGPAQLRIADLNGRILLEETHLPEEGILELNLPTWQWATGSYVLLLDQGGRRSIQRFILH